LTAARIRGIPAPMPPLSTIIATLRRPAETIAIATVGGFAFFIIGFPAGFVSGSMFAVAIAALVGRPVRMPGWLARIFFLAIGISLGTVVTPETLRGMAAAPVSIGVLVLTVVAITAACTYYLVIVHRWTPLSALLAASPGAFAQILALAAEYKADMRAIVIVQSVRVLILGVGLPGALSLFGFEAVPIVRTTHLGAAASVIELGILVVASVATAFALQWLRFPGGMLFGALVGSATLHGTGLIQVALPNWLAYAAMIGTGAVAGARFAGMTLRMLMNDLAAALGSFAVAVALCCIGIAVILQVVSASVPNLVVSFAPGAQETMMIMALALHLDPVFIGAHHLARFLIVSLGIPIAARTLIGPGTPPPPPRKPPQVTPED
jgi:membrane AbrB-like protein